MPTYTPYPHWKLPQSEQPYSPAQAINWGDPTQRTPSLKAKESEG
jgi:hypothetical protein